MAYVKPMKGGKCGGDAEKGVRADGEISKNRAKLVLSTGNCESKHYKSTALNTKW